MDTSPKIKLYTTPLCAFCPLVKRFLEEKGIKDYEEIDVSEDQKAFEEMKEKTGQISVPVLLVGEKAVVGFDRNKLEELLKEAEKE